MIKEYNNGKVITDGNFETPIAVSSARFSFPFENHRSVQLIEQDFVVRSENFSKQNLGTMNSIYTEAVLVSETGFSNLIGGLLKFTRTYLKISNQTFVFAKTSNVTFPSLKWDYTLEQEGVEFSRNLSNIRDSFSKVVPCEERVNFVNLASNSKAIVENDSHIDSSSIDVGMEIYDRSSESIYTITEANSGIFTAVNNSNSTDIKNFHLSQRGSVWNIYSPVFNFDSVSINAKFTPYVENTWENPFSFLSNYYNLPESVTEIRNPVDFVAFNTTPATEEYFGWIENGTRIRIEDTKIEQFMGHIYKVTELFTKAL